MSDAVLPEALTRRVEATLLELDSSVAPRSEAVARAAAKELALAARRAGERDHEVAFELLAADSLLTLACEEAAREGDPEKALSEVLRTLVEEIE